MAFLKPDSGAPQRELVELDVLEKPAHLRFTCSGKLSNGTRQLPLRRPLRRPRTVGELDSRRRRRRRRRDRALRSRLVDAPPPVATCICRSNCGGSGVPTNHRIMMIVPAYDPSVLYV
jgi:hypothetical protein